MSFMTVERRLMGLGAVPLSDATRPATFNQINNIRSRAVAESVHEGSVEEDHVRGPALSAEAKADAGSDAIDENAIPGTPGSGTSEDEVEDASRTADPDSVYDPPGGGSVFFDDGSFEPPTKLAPAWLPWVYRIGAAAAGVAAGVLVVRVLK